MDQAITEDTPPQRSSTSHDRPSRTPYGPRIRTRAKYSVDLTSPGASSPDGTSPLMSAVVSPTFANPFSMLDSPGTELASPSIGASFSDPAAPQPIPSLAHPGGTADIAVQVPSTPPSSSIPLAAPSLLAPTHSEKSTVIPSKPSVATFITPSPLSPPPAISFEPTTIPWKGLPLEAAQWTFSSEELREIVSKAIRFSAKESFVRLLSLQALEVDTVKESERLESERLAAQAKWRFEVGRRTMLMQALNSTAAVLGSVGEGEGGNPIGGLVSQLASSIASCDSVLSSILQYADQDSQIAIVQHRHWSSALGIALRKLNKAYERQAEELKRVQARVQTLEDELDDAWREAERMAVEFDDLEQEIETSEGEVAFEGVDDGEGGDEDAAMQDLDDNVTINTDLGEVIGVTATAVVSKATLLNAPGTSKADKSDTKSVRSVRDGPSYVSRLTAARARSRVASNASLRLPKSLRKSSLSQTLLPIGVPPVPAIPDRPDRVQGQSFLDMGSIGTEFMKQLKKSLPARHPEPKGSLTEPPHTASLPRMHVPSIWLETASGSPTRLNGFDRTHSLVFPSFSSRSPPKRRRSNLVTSLASESDAGGGSAGSLVSTHSNEKIPSSTGRPGSAGGRLTNNNEAPSPRKSLVSRASLVMLRRLSQATSVTKHYTSHLPVYKPTAGNETDTPPRVGTPPNTGEGSVPRSCPD